jgi:hypothetical protein
MTCQQQQEILWLGYSRDSRRVQQQEQQRQHMHHRSISCHFTFVNVRFCFITA